MAIIGIDLGTTNSLVAVWENGQVKIIQNKLGSELTPSAVSVEDGRILVGQPAKDRLITHPDVTVAGFKRYMGTDKRFRLGERSFSPEELSSLVISKLKEDAERYLGETVEEAIISVPAYFNNDQRYATKVAAKLAGVTCNRIINEPSAAALSCRIQDLESEQTVLVFDFGGGTLDVSIVECFENIVEISAIAGDNHLGGTDFDLLIAEKFCEENGLEFKQLELTVKESLLRKAERCKIALSESDSASIHLHYEGKEYQLTLTNEMLIEIGSNLFIKMKQVISRALKDSNLNPSDITDILPVGGSCEMPVVRDYLSHLFKRPVQGLDHADRLVAKGLGVYCGIKLRNEEIMDIMMTDVCPFSLGTDIKNPHDPRHSIMSVIINRNTVLPVKATQMYEMERGSNYAFFEIYQGEGYYVDENVKIGVIGIEDLPADVEHQRIALTFFYDINGILEVTAKVMSTGQEKKVVIVSEHNPLTPEEIENRRKQMEALNFADSEENRAVIAQASRIYAESVGGMREYAADILQYFSNVLRTNSPIKIKRARQVAVALLEQLDEYMNRDIFSGEWNESDWDVPDEYEEEDGDDW